MAHDLIVVSQIYGELTFGNQRHVSISSLPGMRERTIIVSGLSKSHAMTGWRIGYALWRRKGYCAYEQGIICHYVCPDMSQYASIEAIENGDDDIAMMAEEYDRRRMMITDELNRMGLPCLNRRAPSTFSWILKHRPFQ